MRYLFILFLLFTLNSYCDEVKEVSINAPENWPKEIIKLPPGFAPDMKFRGIEDIRFAPGMFKPDAKDFFTYVFLLDGKYGDKLDKNTIESEILIYYKGLGKAVGGKKFNIDPEKFSIDLKSDDGKKFTGTLKWVEPFRTGKPQTLNLEITVWNGKEKQFLFALVSPAKKDSEVWKDLKSIQSKLTIKK